jgi:heterotetrameric sarcosine oxidase alpha subunit
MASAIDDAVAVERSALTRATAVADTTPFRCTSGGLIDRQHGLNFTFDGRSYRGFAGDTLASALLANGVRLVGRSFKYHRPRGILSAGSEEPNALVELGTGARREPNTRATVIELYDGLVARSQNRFPSLKYDLLSVNSLLAPIFAAGFYYKTFMWPAAFWEKLYEPLIRRAAGLGRASGETDPDSYEKVTAHCDVLVIGGGAAGLMAALAAGRAGARVILCDEDFQLGGRCLSENRTIGDVPIASWAQSVAAELDSLAEVRVLRRTTVLGVYDGGRYAAIERVNDHRREPPAFEPRQRLWRIVAKQAVLASGAIERPLVFGDNDRPGVMLAGSVRAYLNRYAVKPGSRAVIFAAGDDALRTLADLTAAGVAVEAVVDGGSGPETAARIAAKAGAHFMGGGVVTRVHGKTQVSGVEVLTPDGATTRFHCDLLAMSGGWTPAVHLTCHLGGKPVWNDAAAAFLPGQTPPGMTVAGAASGRFALAECLADGVEVGRAAAERCGFTARVEPILQVEPEAFASPPLWRVKQSRGKAFIDYQNDVTTDDVALAEREGFRSVEHLKRYTTLGMATDQGKTSNVNGLALMAELTERSIAATGTTRFRPPYTPVTLGVLAGVHRGAEFRPTRLPPSHDWAVEQGAIFTEAGPWLRAQYFPQRGERDWRETVAREVTQTRDAVGICDVSTLGKIDVQGPDAAQFLDRLYINSFSTLAVGRARYGVMLREDGMVFDDGTTARLAEDHFFVTTTTANAGPVMQHMEFCHQVLWPQLDVQFVSVTEQWAQYAVAGPKARALLQRVVDPAHDMSNAAFPYLACADLTVCSGMRARLFRLSFSGELAYEISVPARFGDSVIRRLMELGRDLGVTPYGTEALGVMRIEKGHVAGNELNGQTTARDLGLGKLMSAKKDYIGRVMAARPGLTDPARPSFVGCKPVKRDERFQAGAHLVPQGVAAEARNDQGYLTSVAYSPTLGHLVGLGLLSRGPERIGETVRAVDLLRGGDVLVEICNPVFFDAKGERLRV